MKCSEFTMRAVGKLAAFSICGGDSFSGWDGTCRRQSYSVCRPHRIMDKAEGYSKDMRHEVRQDANRLGRSRELLFPGPLRSIPQRHRRGRQLPKGEGCEFAAE